MLRISITLIASILVNIICSQNNFEKDFAKNYESNIKKEFINDVYIPKNFDEAFSELERLSKAKALEKFKAAPEDIIRRKLHFGLGRWIALNWNFEEGSRFSHLMKELGVSFPDDMIEMTIVSFHRYLNSAPLDLEAQAQEFYKKRESENKERLKRYKPDIEK